MTEVRNPRRTDSELGQAYWQHHDRVSQPTRSNIMGHVSIEVLEGIDSFAAQEPNSTVAKLKADMLQAIGPDADAGHPHTVSRFNASYEKAYDTVFPATRAYLKISHAVNEIASAYSLSAIDLEILRSFDLSAHTDDTLRRFRTELISRMQTVRSVEDVVAYSQVFETYGEVIAFRYLGSRVPTEPLSQRQGQPTPDFRCTPQDDKPFFVEVKTFDIVDGKFRHREMMEDGLEAKIELEEQVKAGKRVAFAETEIDAYRRYGETDTYDPYSLIRVINTLRKKSWEALKAAQFKDGPTFALAITDRLPLPSGKFDLAPYYFQDYADGAISSGVLWHMAYGHPGTPIFRLPRFCGASSLDGNLSDFGLFADPQMPFHGPGMIVLDREQSGHAAYGLINRAYCGEGNWSNDDTEEVLYALCDHWNDHHNSQCHGISADIRK